MECSLCLFDINIYVSIYGLLSNHLKDILVIALDQRTSAMSAGIWINNTGVLLHSRPNPGFSLSYYSFYLKILKIFQHNFFYPRKNKRNINTNITGIPSFRNRLNHQFEVAIFFAPLIHGFIFSSLLQVFSITKFVIQFKVKRNKSWLNFLCCCFHSMEHSL